MEHSDHWITDDIIILYFIPYFPFVFFPHDDGMEIWIIYLDVLYLAFFRFSPA
jgi:hypothetical protein